MNYYDNAMEVHEVAEILRKHGKYRISVYNSCLAMELYLKSKLPLVDDGEQLEFSHDVVNIYRHLNKRFASVKDLLKIITMGRKYFNESRYPRGDTEIYTDEFAKKFFGYVENIISYINNECTATIDDLRNKFL